MAATGEHDADCMLGLVLGQRREEHIDRRAFSVGGARSAKLQPSFADRQNGAGRQNIDMFGLDLFTVSRIDDRHSSRAAEYFRKHTLAVRRQMREDHKRHPIAGGHRLEKLLQRLDTARRSTNADDGEAGHHCFSPSEATWVLSYSLPTRC